MAQARVEVGRLVHVLLQQFVHRRMQADGSVEVGVVARRIGADLDQVARLAVACMELAARAGRSGYLTGRTVLGTVYETVRWSETEEDGDQLVETASTPEGMSAADEVSEWSRGAPASRWMVKRLLDERWVASNSVRCGTICGDRRTSGRALPWLVDRQRV